MGIAVVQDVQINTFGTVVNVTIAAPASGNRLVMLFISTSATIGVAAGSNGLTQRGTRAGWDAASLFLFDSDPITDGPTNVQITQEFNGTVEGVIWEVSGVHLTTPLDAVFNGTNVGNNASMGFTADSDGEAGFGLWREGAGATLTPSGGYSLAGTFTGWTVCQHLEDIGSAGSKTCAASGAAATWAGLGASYRQAVSAADTVAYLIHRPKLFLEG